MLQKTEAERRWSFHGSSTLAGWKLVTTVPLRKIYLDYLFFKKCTVFKKNIKKIKTLFFFLTLKRDIQRFSYIHLRFGLLTVVTSQEFLLGQLQ